MSENQKPHLSPTQLDMICRCGEQWKRRYLEGEILPPSIAMVKGTALHGGAQANMRQKVDSHQDLPVKEIVEAAVASFEAATAGGLMFSEDEAAAGPKAVIGEAKDAVVEMAEVHAHEQAPDYQPVMVERSVMLELPGPYDLMGILDLTDDQNRVTDFKTSQRKKRQADADDSVQLTTYAAAFHALTGAPPTEVRLDTVVRSKTRCERQLLVSHRDVRDMTALAYRINAVSTAIQKGAFTPAVPGSWWCSIRFCGYASTCKFFVDRGNDSPGEE